jgi:NAD(P)-dependent dehydrogenase (short-subunit alcohol dehydrogenase family)
MLLEDRAAVVYGAGGAIGGAVARAFAREGANVFLSGRHLAAVDAVTRDIIGTGGAAEAAQVDALDEQAVDRHVGAVVEKAGRIDVSFSAIGIPNEGIQGIPLVQLSAENFALPITTYTRAHFLTARSAARRMAEKRSGVILTITSTPPRMGIPFLGGLAPAWAAVEALSRDLSAELGPLGIRVICLRPHAIPETATIRAAFELHAKASGMTSEQFQARGESMTHLRRLPTLAELANVAAFMASDRASAMTGTVANLSGGAIVD